jgi:hypothetical protein
VSDGGVQPQKDSSSCPAIQLAISSFSCIISPLFDPFPVTSSSILAEHLKEYPMLRKTLLILAVLCAAVLVGCNKTETTENSNTAAGNSNKIVAASTPATTAPAGEKVGIPECDDFLAKYEACVSGKVPEAARAQYKSTIDQWRSSWKKLAENPATKGTLAAACKQSAEQAATSMKSFGCSW